MSLLVQWTAVRGRERDAVLQELCVRGTGRSDPEAEADVCGLQLANGWYLVHIRDPMGIIDLSFFDENRGVRELSRGAEAVSCYVDESSMYFEASHWRDGVQVWRVEHDGTGAHAQFLGKKDGWGPRHLDVSGTPPAEFEGIRDRWFAEQEREGNDVDLISEIPVDLAAPLTGFRHDGETPEPFEILEPTGDGAPADAGTRRGCLPALLAAPLLGLEWILSRRAGR